MCQLVIVLVAFVTFCFFKQLNLEPTLNTKVIFKTVVSVFVESLALSQVDFFACSYCATVFK